MTEIDETKLVNMQGGAGGYGDTDGGDACGNSGDCNSCDCGDDYTNGVACVDGGPDTNECGTYDDCFEQSYAEACYDSNAFCSEPPVC